MKIKADKNLITIILVSATFIAIVSAFFMAYFEYYKKPVRGEPTEAAKQNLYLAINRWLVHEGHPIRIERAGDTGLLKQADEKTIIIFTSSFNFDNSNEIMEIINNGKNIALIIDNYFDVETYLDINMFDTEDDSLGYDDHEYDSLFYKKIGNGALHIAESPLFMQNNYLNDEINAAQTWKITGAMDKDNDGILMILSTDAEKGISKSGSDSSFFNDLRAKGKLLPLGISTILIIVLALLNSIISIGKYPERKELPGLPLKKRFLAEGRFYKKYGRTELFF